MFASLPDELRKLIIEKIYLDLEKHTLSKRLQEALEDKNKEKEPLYKQSLNEVIAKLQIVNQELYNQNASVYPPIADGICIQYNYLIKTTDGNRTGNIRIWKAALKSKLSRRLNELLK